MHKHVFWFPWTIYILFLYTSERWVKKVKILKASLEREDQLSKTLIAKAKYKRGNSARKIAKQLFNKSLSGSAVTVSRCMSEKRWKPFRRKKKNTFELKTTPSSHLDPDKYQQLTAEEREFFFRFRF